MRYKKGDKVIIKSREWYNENKDESGIITFSTDRGDYHVTKEDERFFGRVVTITYVGVGYYIIAEDDGRYVWIDEIIEGPSTSIYNEGDIVSIYDYETDIRIEEVRWDGSSYSYKVHLADEEKWLYYNDIAYKLEIYNSLVSDNTEFMSDNEIKLPYGYVFKDENGNVINTTKITIEKKKDIDSCK